MKYILNALIAFIFITGCNSDNSDSSIPLEPVIDNIVQDGNASITSPNEIYTVVLSVTDQNNEFVDGGTIKVQGFDNKYGSFREVNVDVVQGKAIFEYEAPSDISILDEYTFIFKAENADASALWKVNFALPTLETLRVEIKTLTLNSSSEEKSINVLAYGSDNKPYSGTNVIIKDYQVDTKLGYFTRNSAELIDGVATFTFKGPEPLVNMTDSIFTFAVDDKNGTKSDTMTIKYDPITIIKPTITDVAHDGNITVSSVNEKHLVTLSVTDENGLFINDGIFNIKGFNAKYGSFTESSVTIKNGRATFEYTAPSDFTGLSSYNFTFVDSNLNKTLLWKVTFNQPKLTTLKIETPSIILTKNAQTETIKVLAYDENSKPINKQFITIKDYSIDPSKGYFTRKEAEIVDGVATFEYVGPNPLTRLNDTNITLESDRDATVFDRLNVKYQPSSEQKAIASITHDGNITVTSPNEKFNILLFIKDEKGNFITDGTIEVGGFDPKFGSFTSVSAKVVEGKALFQYTSAKSIENLVDFNFTFQDKNSNINTLWQVDFQAAKLKTLQLEESIVTIDDDAQEKSIKVIARDQSGKPFSGKEVSLFVKSDNNTSSYETNTTIGYFNSEKVELINGVAEFTFYGPKSLSNFPDTTYEFRVEDEAVDTNATLTILYRPNKPEVGIVSFDENSSYVATINGESIKLNVKVSNAQGSPMADGVVRAIYPTEWSKTDVGVLLNDVVKVEGGRATFEFRAPNDMNRTNYYLSQNSEGNFTKWYFSYNDTPADEKYITIEYRPIADQVVITNYEMEFQSIDISSNIFPIESQYTFTVKLLDQDKNLVDSSKVSNISVQLKSSLLGILQKDNTTTLSADINNSNSFSFVLKSGTKSGTVPVIATITYRDNNGNTQTMTKAYSVIVQSGPATAMSINLINTEASEEYAGFKSRYEVKVIDRYGNSINTTPTFSTGIIAGYAGFSAQTPSNARFSHANGEYGKINKETNELNVTNNSFDTNVIELGNDTLVTFAQGYSYNVSGNFDFEVQDANRVKLSEELALGQDETNVSYALGHNYRQIIGTANEAVARAVSEDGNYTINSEGRAIIDLYYDPYLVGKDVILWINLVGDKVYSDTNSSSGHFGEAKVLTLLGKGISVSNEVMSIPKSGSAVTSIYYVTIEQSVEDYRHGRFRYNTDIKGEVDCNVSDSMNGSTTSNAIYLNDTAFIRATCQVINIDKNSTDGSFSVEIYNNRVSKEFQ